MAIILKTAHSDILEKCYVFNVQKYADTLYIKIGKNNRMC